jgi:hypothetical protein
MMAMDLTAYPGVNSFFDLLTGELQSVNRLAGGPIASYAVVGADITLSNNPGIVYGVLCTVSGTLEGVYDNTAASGTKVVPTQVMTAGNIFSFPGNIGVLCPKGIYANWTSGEFIIFYVGG